MIGYPAVPAGRMHLGVKACIIAANRRAPAINCAGETRRLNLAIKKWLRADPPSSKGRTEDPANGNLPSQLSPHPRNVQGLVGASC